MNSVVLENKKAIVEEIKAKVQANPSLVLIDYQGLTVDQDTQMRSAFRENNVEYHVYKNKFILRAFQELGIEGFDDCFKGPTAIAMSTDTVAPAKVAVKFINDFKKMAVKAGLVDGKFMAVEEVNKLAKIPAKEVLIAQLLGMLQAPIRNLACVLDAAAKKAE